MALNIQGIVINEILANPVEEKIKGGNKGFDTDGSGKVRGRDEFVELANTTGSDIDVSGWTISNGSGEFTFPEGTTIAAGEAVTIVGNYKGTPPAGFFEGLPKLRNNGDAVVLSDGSKNIGAVFNGGGNLKDVPDGTAVEDFGNIPRGQSAQRSDDGDITVGEPNPECFLTGTLVQTADGEKRVEDLQIGDLVQTLGGQPERIKWIGCQTLGQEGLHPFRAYPVQIKAGALGNQLPARDLYVSPDHAILVEGVLANAGALINGTSIVQIKPEAETFNYYHIELERHALLLAEGVPAESFIPQNVEGRDKFDNVEEFAALYPEGDALSYMPMSFPRVSSQRQLPRSIAQHLEQIALEVCPQVAQVA